MERVVEEYNSDLRDTEQVKAETDSSVDHERETNELSDAEKDNQPKRHRGRPPKLKNRRKKKPGGPEEDRLSQGIRWMKNPGDPVGDHRSQRVLNRRNRNVPGEDHENTADKDSLLQLVRRNQMTETVAEARRYYRQQGGISVMYMFRQYERKEINGMKPGFSASAFAIPPPHEKQTPDVYRKQKTLRSTTFSIEKDIEAKHTISQRIIEGCRSFLFPDSRGALAGLSLPGGTAEYHSIPYGYPFLLRHPVRNST